MATAANSKSATGKTSATRTRKATGGRASSAKKTTAAKAAQATVDKVDSATQASEEKVRATAASIRNAAEKAIAATHAPDAAKAVKDSAKSVAAKARRAPARRGRGGTARSAAARPKGVGAGTVIGVAAAGLVAGLAANLGRKAAVQAPSVMAGDWLEALKAEHKAALALLDRLAQSNPEQPAKRTLLLSQLKHALGKHAFTEENVIYPALRDWGDKADADALNHEQGYHKQFLYDLEKMDKSAPGFAQMVADFRADLEKHIREEEDKILPQLHKGLSEEQNKALTQMANKEGFRLA